jgi:ketosteroid isomerase-like protein
VSRSVEIVRTAFERFTTASLFDVLAADVEWHVRSDLTDAGTYRGHEGMRQLLKHFGEILDDLWIEPLEFIESGEATVIVPLRWGGTGKGSGIEIEERGGETWVFTVRHGKIARVDEFPTREQALEAAGPGTTRRAT